MVDASSGSPGLPQASPVPELARSLGWARPRAPGAAAPPFPQRPRPGGGARGLKGRGRR